MDKKHCSGCEDNFYNGNNPYGVGACYRLKKAKLAMRKQVSLSQVPPWKQKPIKVPDCYRVRGYVFVDGKREY